LDNLCVSVDAKGGLRNVEGFCEAQKELLDVIDVEFLDALNAI
jgi:hypothetical protein